MKEYAEKQRTDDREMYLKFLNWYYNFRELNFPEGHAESLVDTYIASGQIPAKETKSELNLFDAYSDFVWKTFADASCNDHLKKLKVEIDEAIQDNKDIYEFADCLGAIYGAVTKAGFSYNELIKAGFEKLEINKTRKWEKLSDGTYQHIKY